MSMPEACCPVAEPSRHNQPRERQSLVCEQYVATKTIWKRFHLAAASMMTVFELRRK
jgi:hypothetical protein